MNLRKWALLALFCSVAVAVSVFWAVTHRRLRPVDYSAAGLLARLPSKDAVLLFVDFDALRKSGILQSSARPKVVEEPDYQAFVHSTGFDYKTDLMLAAVSFRPEGDFFVIQGNFDWEKLRSYVAGQGGRCFGDLCRMPGSTPSRQISIVAVSAGVMALAVSSDDSAAMQLAKPIAASQAIEMPGDPLWISVPAATLQKFQALPGGTRILAKAMENSEMILLSLGPGGAQYQARIEITCRTPDAATTLAEQLTHITTLLTETIAHEKRKPDPNDLGGVLTAGAFAHAGTRVTGRWPLSAGFLETLAGGGL